MAKNKKSKILAMALCASVMTGIYAAPVMAADTDIEATDGNINFKINGNTVGTITHDNTWGFNRLNFQGSALYVGSISTTGASMYTDGRIFGAHGKFAVEANGLNIYSDNERTDKTFGVNYDDGSVIAAGGKFTVDKDGNTVSKGDVTSTAADGTTTYSLNTVGNNTSGITIDSEGKVTTIEGVFSVDEKGYIYNANRSFQVTKDGAARFGNKYDDHIRMEDGVLSVKTDQNTTVARVSKDGFYVYKDNGTVAGSLTKNGLTADSINVGGENFTVAHDGSVKAADERFIIDADGNVTATEFTAGGYNLTDIGEKTAGIRRTQSDATDVTVIEENLKVYDDGTIVGAKENFKVTADGTVISDKLNVGNGNFTVSDEGIGAFGSQFTVNTDGEISTTGINVAKGMFTASDDGVTMADGNMKLDTNGNITAGTYNGVKIGMNEDGDIILGDGTVIDDKFNSDNVAGITRKPLDDSAPGSGNTTYIEQNTAISADGIVVRDPGSGVSTKTKYDGFYVKDKYSNIVSSLKDDGLMLTDQESGETHTLNATDIADIKGIDRSGNDTDGYKTTIEGATSFTKDGMVTSNITTDNITTDSFTAGVTEDSSYDIKATGEMLFRSGGNYIGMDRNRIGFTSGTESVTINGDGTTFTSDDSTTRTTTSTVIKGGTITTGSTTITSDSITTKTLNVDKIVLGDKIVDKNTGDVIGGELEIGADGSVKIDNADTDAVEFNATKTALSANYGGTSLNMDSNGFNLNNGTGIDAESFVLNADGFAFKGSLNLGAGSDVKYTGGNYGTLAKLDATVKDIYDRTDGIYKDGEGNTVISNETGTWNDTTQKTEYTGEGSKVVVGDNGTTFEGTGVGTTNINGGKVTVNGNDSTVTTIDGSEIVSDATASSTVTGGAGAGTGTVNGGYAEFDKGEGDKTIVDGGNVNVSNKITVGTGTTEITGDHVIVGVHDANKSNIGKGEATFDKGEDGKTIVNGGNVTTGNITADTGKIGNVEFTADGTTFEDGSENQTVIDKNGIVVGANDGTKIDKDDVSINDKNGGRIHLSDMGQVDNIDAELKQNDNYDDTVVGGINAEADIRRTEVARLDDRITKVEDRVDKVGAMSAAIANLRTIGYDPAAPTEIAVGIGQYRSETGAALGLFHYPNRDFMLSLSVSTSGDEVMGGIGATWKFGRKSPEKVAEIKKAQAEADARRAEEAKLAKAEEMKQAAKEAKIKAQQERHAKLAAERAAQAEATK